jgi:hypothetical protein
MLSAAMQGEFLSLSKIGIVSWRLSGGGILEVELLLQAAIKIIYGVASAFAFSRLGIRALHLCFFERQSPYAKRHFLAQPQHDAREDARPAIS